MFNVAFQLHHVISNFNLGHNFTPFTDRDYKTGSGKIEKRTDECQNFKIPKHNINIKYTYLWQLNCWRLWYSGYARKRKATTKHYVKPYIAHQYFHNHVYAWNK